MKLAVAGKGGVGKTTLVALLAREAVARGYRVLAVDADSNATLAVTLGFPDPIVSLADDEDLIVKRAGAAGLVNLNPTVDDIPDRYAVERDGIKLLVLGGIRRGGGGCACPANKFLRALLRHLLLKRDEAVVVDMEAGVEHLGRGTAQGVDALIVVVDPDRRSLDTAARILPLAQEIGLRRIVAVGNKVADPEEEAFIRHGLPLSVPLLGSIPLCEELGRVGRGGPLPSRAPPSVQDLFSQLEVLTR